MRLTGAWRNVDRLQSEESQKAYEMLRRPELSYGDIISMAGLNPTLDLDQAAELETEVKYEGYVRRQAEVVERHKRLEDAIIPVGA